MRQKRRSLRQESLLTGKNCKEQTRNCSESCGSTANRRQSHFVGFPMQSFPARINANCSKDHDSGSQWPIPSLLRCLRRRLLRGTRRLRQEAQRHRSRRQTTAINLGKLQQFILANYSNTRHRNTRYSDTGAGRQSIVFLDFWRRRSELNRLRP
jgi:hypothetical protein